MSSFQEQETCFPEGEASLALIDRPRWGWTAGAGVDDLLTPHERARRSFTKSAFIRRKRKREGSQSSFLVGGPAASNKEAQETAETNHPKEPQHPLVDSDVDQESKGKEPSADDPTGPERKSVKFSALSTDGILDCSVYHRGVEGREIRDEITGELLCDTEPTDTNHGNDTPKLLATVTVEIPLEEDGRCFKDTVQWDLSDKWAQTPMQFSTKTAEEFGLSVAQTLNLAESIQDQLRRFVHDNCAYAPPVSLKSEVTTRPPPVVPILYGQLTNCAREGACYISKSANGGRGILRSIAGGALLPSGSERLAQSTKGKKMGPGNKRKRESSSSEEASFREEVQKRLIRASEEELQLKYDSNEKEAVLGAVLSKKDKCHTCQKEERCGAFACNKKGHAFCSDHLQEYFESQEGSIPIPLTVSACPICSLSCGCPSCSKILQTLATDFCSECAAQSCTPELTKFDELFSRCQLLLAARTECKKRRSSKRMSTFERPIVPKVPVSDFPREIFNDIDIDPGSDIIYATVFTKDGSSLAQADTPPLAHNHEFQENGKIVEDGSVDYCNVCKKFGDLMCCDVCPRAFHAKCIPSEKHNTNSGDERWVCPSCRREGEIRPEDKLDGTKYHDVVFCAFDNLNREFSTEDLKSLKTISIVYEMLLLLMDFDFGVWFREPVDLSVVPNYSSIVEESMDLGTIASNIINGHYRDTFCKDDNTVEEALLAILKDLELVWHNCFLFNLEGSSVYRMAGVQRRRANSIRRQSYDSLLSERLKRDLLEYDRKCCLKRRASSQAKEPTPHPDSNGGARPLHTIVATSSGAKGRPFCIFDPDSGRVIKMYTTVSSAVSVAALLLKLRHPCEWDYTELNGPNKLRALITKSQIDPNLHIFGYRWLFFDDLENGKVTFTVKADPNKTKESSTTKYGTNGKSKPFEDNQAIEMFLGDRCFVFASFEEALAYSGVSFSSGSPLLAELNAMPFSDTFKEVGGKRWRRRRLSVDSSAGGGIEKIEDVVFVKVDTVSNQVVVGFHNIDSAYDDWIRTLNASLADNNGPTSSESFRSLYLNGGESVDGMEWKTSTFRTGPTFRKTTTDQNTVNGDLIPTSAHNENTEKIGEDTALRNGQNDFSALSSGDNHS